jgi:hypothetical protein
LVALGFPALDQLKRAEFTVYGWPQRHRFYGGFKRNNARVSPSDRFQAAFPLGEVHYRNHRLAPTR